MFVALDATYLVDPHPSGIAVYSRELLDGLALSHPQDRFLHLYRLKQFRRSLRPRFSNVKNRLLSPLVPSSPPWRRLDLFHALNQRVDSRPARRVLSTFHDLFVMSGEYSTAEFRARFTDQARRAAQRSDLIIAVSDFTRDQIISYLKIDPARVRVIPHGVHMPPLSPPLDRREKIILCVGALQRRKNVIRLVEAFEHLPRDPARNWRLILAGSTAGFGANEIVNRIEHSPRLFDIQLRGYVTAPDLLDLYRRASIFAFPSLDEGFGIPILEAMAHGLPVLTSNRSALPQVAGGAALLADPYSTDEICYQLTRLINDAPLCESLRAKGLQRASEFSWRLACDRTFQLYRELLG